MNKATTPARIKQCERLGAFWSTAMPGREAVTPTLPGTETSGVVDGSLRSPHSLRFDMARRC